MDKIFAVIHVHEIYDYETCEAIMPDNEEYVGFFSTKEKAEAFVLEHSDIHTNEYGCQIGELIIKELLLDNLIPGESLWWKRDAN